MWWGKGSDKPEAPKDKPSDAPPAQATKIDPRNDATQFDPNKLPDHRNLPKGLQSIVDKSDTDGNFYDEIVSG